MNEVLKKQAFKVVGTRPIRPDGVDKVTGRAMFGADFRLPGMLVGKVKRSPHAHAKIISIDTRKARALPGVKAVITAADLPDMASQSMAAHEAAFDLRDVSLNCLARGKVLYQGHAIAAVAATSSAIADEALDLIEVKYEVLPHVLDIASAMAPGAPLVHENLLTEGLPEPAKQPSNVAKTNKMGRGDVAKGFAEADVIVEGRYTTQAVHQGYIEPHACVAQVGQDGQCQIWTCTQGQFMVRTCCAKLLGIDIANIRVTASEMGGGFGGKTTVYLEPLALALARQSSRPVKMVMSREEVFRASGPTPATTIEVKLGAKNDGTITAAEIVFKFLVGAFPGGAAWIASMTATAAYTIPNIAITGFDIVANTPKTAAYRAPNAPAAAFAFESAVDELARKLHKDPIELRLKNGVVDGSRTVYGAVFENIAYHDTLKSIKSHPHYSAPLGKNQGRGIAMGFWFNVGGESSAAVHINEDGTATVITGSPDVGGSRASMAIMAAEILGLPVEKVRPVVGDTASIPYSMTTGGSRTTFATGMAVVQACEKVVEDLKRRAAQLWKIPVDQVDWQAGGAICLDASKTDLPPMPLSAIATEFASTGGPISAEVALNAQGAGPSFAVHMCDVEIDRDTGMVTVLRYTAAQDVGKAIHPSYVEGQIQGGAAQGIGWALNEEYIFDSKGVMENPGFLDYRMPVASDLPMIDTILVETAPNPKHPFGAKGVGEVPIVPPLAAVANAVRAALGVRMCDLPLSPPKIRAVIDSK